MTEHQFQVSDIHVGLELPGGWEVSDLKFDAKPSKREWTVRHRSGTTRRMRASQIRDVVRGAACPPSPIKQTAAKIAPGDRFEFLTALRRLGYSAERKHTFWDFVCVCGRIKSLWAMEVQRREHTSCGCMKPALNSPRLAYSTHLGRHGMTGSRTYRGWANLRRYHQNNPGWHHPWNEFENFLADLGEAPEGAKLDRRDQSLPHGPGNTYWKTR